MKKQLRRILFLLACSLCALGGYADEVEIDGIYYNLDEGSNTASVTRCDIEYSGAVVIPSSFAYEGVTYAVTGIEDYAFACCSSLTSVTIPNTVTSIRYKTFWGCSGLTSVIIPNSVTSIGFEAFQGCSGLASVTIPNSVKSIGDCAFQGCSSLTFIILPNSVTSIGCQAFQDCRSLTSVTIPNSVTSIGGYAFGGCDRMMEVYAIGETPARASGGKDVSFTTIYQDECGNKQYATLHVPAGCILAYQQAEGWKEFKNIVEWDVMGIGAAPTAAAELGAEWRAVADGWQMRVDGTATDGTYALYGTNGQTIASGKLAADGTWQRIGSDGLPRGTYLLRLSAGGKARTLKLLAR